MLSSRVLLSGLRAGGLATARPAAVVASSGATQRHSRSLTYNAPRRDIKFILNEVLDAETHYKSIGAEDVNEDLIDSIIGECAKLCENSMFPIYLSSDEGCTFKDGKVTTPKGFKKAYEEYNAAGWQSLTVPEEYGGQGLPLSLGLIKAELLGTANWSFGMFPGLSIGCMNTLMLHGDDEMKKVYLPKLASGEWTGTMCLTEAHCGSDLSQMTTMATPQEDGTFKLKGQKIFISCGEHDLTSNIIHIVLARTPNAPPGLKGISLFLVPKHLSKADGSLEAKQNIVCAGIEKKMGIHGSPTCVMQFEDSIGYQIGEINQGLMQMFTFMNTARIGTALQGIGAAELALQGALPYARERISGRALSGAKAPEQAADPIIFHPDVRRMLLTAKAFAEGGRAMMYHTALVSDNMLDESPEAQAVVEDDLGFLTPILKGFLTEVGLEAAKDGMQVYGGHGYLKDWGMEQNYRDARIGTMYEGTTTIQGLDLLGRKIMLRGGGSFRKFCYEVLGYCGRNVQDYKNCHFMKESAVLAKYTTQWMWYTVRIGLKARNDREMVGCAANDFLMYSGYVSLGYFWLRMMDTAAAQLAKNPHGPDAAFYQAKVDTGKFYFERILTRADSHATAMLKSPGALMKMADAGFDAHF